MIKEPLLDQCVPNGGCGAALGGPRSCSGLTRVAGRAVPLGAWGDPKRGRTRGGGGLVLGVAEQLIPSFSPQEGGEGRQRGGAEQGGLPAESAPSHG